MIYIKAPKMNRLNKIVMDFIICLQFYQKYASLQLLFKIFAQICSVVIYKEVFEILQTYVSQKTI